MVSWQAWSGTAAGWDQVVTQFADFTVYQGSAWADHRLRFGWRSLRLVAYSGGKIVAATQVLVRRYPLGLGVVWIPGGPLGEASTWGRDLQRAIRVASGLRVFYCRLNALRQREYSDEEFIKAQGWTQTSNPLLSGKSLEYHPSVAEEQRILQCSGNWRHNLRRSFKRGLKTSVWPSPSPVEMMQAYESMQEHKGLAAQTSEVEIESLLLAFGADCLLVRCNDEHGNLLALRGALVMGSKAWDIFAVANPAGRKVYASHAAFWELMSQCALRGVTWYDMSGADPVNNRGVYDFKKGSGAADVTQLGEWEFAYPRVVRPLASYLIGWRGRA